MTTTARRSTRRPIVHFDPNSFGLPLCMNYTRGGRSNYLSFLNRLATAIMTDDLTDATCPECLAIENHDGKSD